MALLHIKRVFILSICLIIIISLNMNGKAVKNDTYNNLTLDEAIELALEKNPEIKIAEKKLIKAKAELKESKAEKLPTLNFNSSYTRKDKADLKLLSKDIYQTSLKGSYPLYTGHKITNRITNSQREIQKAKLELEESKKEINFKVIEWNWPNPNCAILLV